MKCHSARNSASNRVTKEHYEAFIPCRKICPFIHGLKVNNTCKTKNYVVGLARVVPQVMRARSLVRGEAVFDATVVCTMEGVSGASGCQWRRVRQVMGCGDGFVRWMALVTADRNVP